MSTHPYIPLYVDDFDAATTHLTIEEDGVYSRLLRLCWRTPGCSVPNDPTWIARKIRLSADDFERVARPVIEEFFRVQRGRLVQKRLKAEYDDITRKKTARVNAGKKGGAAKALKTGDDSSGNATGLPPHAGAFPEPKPEPESKKERTPSPQGGEVDLKRFAKALAVVSDAGCGYDLAVDRIHKAQPVVDGKRRSTAPDVQRALAAALKRGGMPSAIWSAVQRYYALPASTKDGGQFASGAAVILNKDRWQEFLADPAGASVIALPAAVFDGPPEIRTWAAERLTEGYARSYIDPSGWDAGNRALLAANPFAEGRLKRDLAEICDRWKFTVRQGEVRPPAPSNDLFQQGASA